MGNDHGLTENERIAAFIELVDNVSPAMQSALEQWRDLLTDQDQWQKPTLEKDRLIEPLFDRIGPAIRFYNRDTALYTLRIKTHEKLSIQQPIHIISDPSVQRLAILGLNSTEQYGEEYKMFREFKKEEIERDDFARTFYCEIQRTIECMVELAA